MRIKFISAIALMAISFSHHALASTYSLPDSAESVVGEVQFVTSSSRETIVDLAKQYNLGFDQIKNANPQLDPKHALPSGDVLKLPTAFILPPLPRQGVVINLPEMRIYYFPKGSDIVMTYPVGIGKVGKTVPLTSTFVARKVTNPTWTPTEPIREFNREQGIILPKSIPPGPDNPLGPYAIYLGIPEYRIHSTIFPESIGKRASFGCIRMNESDIKDFFALLTPKTPVNIVDIPTKVGWQDDKLYLEAHPPLEERPTSTSTYAGIVSLIQQATKNQDVLVDWSTVEYLARIHDGVPHEIGVRLR